MTPHHGRERHGAANEDELDPDEPRTPLWLPLLGLCLFVAALVYLVTGQQPPVAESEATPSASASAPAPSAPPPQ